MKPRAARIATALVLAVDCALVVLLAVRLSGVELIDNAIDIWFDRTDPIVDVYQQEKRDFEREGWVVVNAWTEEPDGEALNRVSASLTRQFRELDNISSVLSPHNIDVLQRGGEGLFYDDISPDTSWAERRRTLLEHPVARDLVVHPGQPTLVSFLLKERTADADSGNARQALLSSVRRILNEQPGVVRSTVTGAAVINAELNRLSWGDFLLLVPLSGVVVSLLILLLLRHVWRGALAVIVSGSLSTVALCAAMLALGVPFTMVTIALPGVVFTLGVASGLHVIKFYLRDATQTGVMRGIETTRRLARPIAVSHITTATGFGLLFSIPVLPVQDMALFGALGVLWSGVHTALLLPQLLALLKPAVHSGGALFRGESRLLGPVERVARFVTSRHSGRGRIAISLAVLAGVLAVFISSLRVDSTYLHMVDEDEPMRRDYNTLEQEQLPGATLSVVVTREGGGEIDAGFNSALAEASRKLEALPAVRKVVGPTEVYREAARELSGEQSLQAYSTDTDQVTDAYIFALTGGNKQVTDYVHESLNRFRMVLLIDYLTNSRLQALIDDHIRPILDQELAPVDNGTARVSGLARLWANMDHAILKGQLFSISLMALLCFLIFLVSLRRLKLAAIATVVNFLPVATIAAIMGAAGMRFDLAAVFILSLCLGIAIDDTSFFVHRYQRERYRATVGDSVIATIRAVTPAMAATTIVIAVGFSLQFFSNFTPMRSFGGFIALGVALATVFDAFLLPLLLFLYDKETERVPDAHAVA